MAGYIRVFCKECNKYDELCMSLVGADRLRSPPTVVQDLMAMITYKTILEADERIFWKQKFGLQRDSLGRASAAYGVNFTKKRRKL